MTTNRSPYTFLQKQLSYQTGRQGVECPICHGGAHAQLSRLSTRWASSSNPKAKRRHVVMTCLHCHTHIDFCW